MPAFDLNQGQRTLSRYDIVGLYSERAESFVRHVGLLSEDVQDVNAGDEINAVHMRPPLEKGGLFKVDVAGEIPLTNDERKQLDVWIDKIDDEYPRFPTKQYVINPPFKDEYDSNTGVHRYRRYSCAGFVLDGYSQVNIELLDIEKNSLPMVDRETLISAYPVYLKAKKYPNLLNSLGISGDGPWKVVLPGYILHALNRSNEEIRQEPYNVKEGDEKFPR